MMRIQKLVISDSGIVFSLYPNGVRVFNDALMVALDGDEIRGIPDDESCRGVPLLAYDADADVFQKIQLRDNTEYEFAASNYFVDTDHEPGRINLEHGISWPAVTLRDINGLKIRFVAGYGDAATDVPQAAKEAITLYCAYRNENRIGETEVPKAFYDILRPDRVYYQ